MRVTNKNKTLLTQTRRHENVSLSNKNRVFSYRSQRVVTNSLGASRTTNKQSKLYLLIKHAIELIAVIVIVVSLFYVLGLSSNVSIVVLNGSDNPLPRDKSVYQIAATNILKNSLTAKTKLTINTDHLEQVMKAKFPELANVSVALPLIGHKPIVEITTAKPMLLLTTDNMQIFTIDSRGRVMMPANEVVDLEARKLVLVQDQSATPLNPGKSILTSSDVNFINQVIYQLHAEKLKVSSAILPTSANELHIRLEGQPYFIKFNTQLDVRQSVGTFLAVKQKLETDQIIPAEYIDVRIEEKAYFK